MRKQGSKILEMTELPTMRLWTGVTGTRRTVGKLAPPPPEHHERRKRSRGSPSARGRRGRSLDSSSSDSGDEQRMARTKRHRKHSCSDSSPSPRRDRRSKKWHRATRSSSREVRMSDTSTSDESDYERYIPKVSSKSKKWKLKGSQKKWVRDAFTKYYGEEELDHVLRNCPPPSHTFLKADEVDKSVANGLAKKVSTTAATIALQRDAMDKKHKLKVIQPM